MFLQCEHWKAFSPQLAHIPCPPCTTLEHLGQYSTSPVAPLTIPSYFLLYIYIYILYIYIYIIYTQVDSSQNHMLLHQPQVRGPPSGGLQRGIGTIYY